MGIPGVYPGYTQGIPGACPRGRHHHDGRGRLPLAAADPDRVRVTFDSSGCRPRGALPVRPNYCPTLSQFHPGCQGRSSHFVPVSARLSQAGRARRNLTLCTHTGSGSRLTTPATGFQRRACWREGA